MMGLRETLEAATPGPWQLTEPEDSWHFKLASIICLGTSGSNDLDLAALAPELAALVLDMGEALRPLPDASFTRIGSAIDRKHVSALLARLDQLGKEQT